MSDQDRISPSLFSHYTHSTEIYHELTLFVA